MRFPFTSFPDGIFAVLFSHELEIKQVRSIMFMNQKLAIFRTKKGEVGAVDAYCPHLGADLTFGSVFDDCLRCPFHGMQFKINKTTQWEVFEKFGFIFLKYNPAKKNFHFTFPEWNMNEWGQPVHHYFKIKSHPQEILENSVDLLHFKEVHNYDKIKIIEPLKITGSEFTIRYQLERKKGLFGDQKKIQLELAIHAYGLGLSHVDISIPEYSFKAKQIVLPTPIDGDFIDIRTLTSVKLFSQPWMPYFLRKLMANFLTKLAARGFVRDFMPDLTIWENKKYNKNPNYFSEDGEFEKYRQWASQFYRDELKDDLI